MLLWPRTRIGRVACEVATTNGLVIVIGEITTTAYVEIPKVVREVVKDIGYTNPEYGFDYRSCGVLVSINEQSADIDMGVSKSWRPKKAAASAISISSAPATRV